MSNGATIYVAVCAEDRPIADVLLAHIKQYGFRCVNASHVPDLLNRATDTHGTMSDADMIVLIDSHAFRQRDPNYELQYAQSLRKPLVVVSLHQKVDESRSTWRVRLFDFTNPRHRIWRRIIETIVSIAEDLQAPNKDGFLF